MARGEKGGGDGGRKDRNLGADGGQVQVQGGHQRNAFVREKGLVSTNNMNEKSLRRPNSLGVSSVK